MLPKVICIDDEAHNNEALERLLRKKFEVITTTQPQEGLELIKKYQPALIISDQRMPQITGVELLKKSMLTSPDSIRMLLTGYTDLESVIAAINEGQIYRYLTKPWEPNDLMITVDKAYETYQLKLELKAQNEQLKSLDRLKTEFMILVTHELRTPLTGMSSFLDLLKEEIKNSEHKTYLQHIEKNTNRLKKLVEDILIITKLKTETYLTSSYTRLKVNELLEEEWKKIKDKNKTLSFKIKSDAEEIVTHEGLFRELIHRLLLNCVQHASKDSEVTLLLDYKKADLIITITNETEQKMNVEPQNLISAFTKNEKIMNHTQGTGLGLSIANALTQALMGDLQISAKNQKFNVTLRIPQVPA